jgi:hypothetical protein
MNNCQEVLWKIRAHHRDTEYTEVTPFFWLPGVTGSQKDASDVGMHWLGQNKKYLCELCASNER